MSRGFQISGESMVYVKGMAGCAIAALSELGLPEAPITVTFDNKHDDVMLDAWGDVPADLQCRLGVATVRMTLVDYDPDVLEECIRLAAGAPTVVGRLPRAGTLMGNRLPRLAAGNKYVGLNIASPVGGRPYRFLTSHIQNPGPSIPLGTKRSIIDLTWRAIPYTQDPWNNGLGASEHVLWDRTADG